MTRVVWGFLAILVLQQPGKPIGEYESSVWPADENEAPRCAAKSDSLVLHARSDQDARRLQISCRRGWLVAHDRRLYRTLAGVDLIARAETSATCRVTVRRGETIRYLQYGAERFGVVRIRGRICEIDLDPRVFDGLGQEPQTERLLKPGKATSACHGV